MSPRAYRTEKRQVARDSTRARILDAARQLLADEATRDLSMEAVARRADVARLTIYYQFGSRAGLLEALFDHLATRGNMQRTADVFRAANPSEAVDRLVSTFVGFWAADPSVIRRLRAMAVLDQEISKGIRARDARRAQIARDILKWANLTKRGDARPRHVADVLSMLISFESYDVLARGGLSSDQIVAILRSLAQSVLAQVLPPTAGKRSGSAKMRPRKPAVT